MGKPLSIKRFDYIDVTQILGMLTIIWGYLFYYGWSNQMALLLD